VRAAEEIVGRELNVESGAHVAVTAALAAAKMDQAVVVHPAFVVDHRAGQQVVAHHVGLVHALGGPVHQVDVGGGENDSDVVGE
jgi:hypothetical protein